MGGAIGVILGVFRQEHTKENTPMALSESVLSDLLAAFRAGEGVDLIRDSVQLVLQELIEVEATEAIGPLATNAPIPGSPSATGRGPAC